MAKRVNCPDFSFKVRSIVILFLLPYIIEVVDGYSHDKERKCGILYSEENFGGEKYTLNDQDRSLNLAEDSDQNGWNTTGSVEIEKGCLIDICKEAYFGGDCNQMSAGIYPSSTYLNMTDFQSVDCTCAKV